MPLLLVFLCADGNVFLEALVNGFLCLAYWTLPKDGVHEGSVLQVPVPTPCLAKRAAKDCELMLPLAIMLSWVSSECVLTMVGPDASRTLGDGISTGLQRRYHLVKGYVLLHGCLLAHFRSKMYNKVCRRVR